MHHCKSTAGPFALGSLCPTLPSAAELGLPIPQTRGQAMGAPRVLQLCGHTAACPWQMDDGLRLKHREITQPWAMPLKHHQLLEKHIPPGSPKHCPSTRDPEPSSSPAALVSVQLSVSQCLDRRHSAWCQTLRAPADPTPGCQGLARASGCGVPGLAPPAAPVHPGPCRLQMDAIKLILQRPIIAVSSAWQHDPGSPHYTNHCDTNTIAEHIKTWCASC